MNRASNFLRHRPDAVVACLCALAALLPFLIHLDEFGRLFWFGDEWELLDQIDQRGFWPWVRTIFTENYVPLFKTLWGGIVIVGGGSHMLMLWVLWLTHAAGIAVLYGVMRTADFTRPAAAASATLAGVGWMNLESLSWTLQWSSVLATGFSVAGVWCLLAARPLAATKPAGPLAGTVLLCAAAAFSFSRGVLIGPVLAFIALLPWITPALGWGRRVLVAAVVLAPFLWSAGNIIASSPGNHQHLGSERLADMAAFGWTYYALNPVHAWFGFDSWGWRTCLLFGVPKVALTLWVLYASRGTMRTFLLAMILLDLGNAALLGIGRHHTGLPSTTSMRYQYASLFSTLPVFAFAFGRALAHFRVRFAPASWIAGAVLAFAFWCAVRDWPVRTAEWAQWRGDVTREVVAPGSAAPPIGAIPGINFMTTARARELVDIYDLH